jgi:hypothetical protein
MSRVKPMERGLPVCSGLRADGFRRTKSKWKSPVVSGESTSFKQGLPIRRKFLRPNENFSRS